MRGRRGAALITAIYVAFFILLFGMTLATVSTFEYQFTNQSMIRGRAFEAAQAGLAQAVYDLGGSSTWNASLLNQTVATDGSSYSLTFNNGLGIAWSTNNLNSSTSATGWNGQTVPQYSALLVATGSVPSSMSSMTGAVETRVVEELVQYQSYPYALAASNQITATALTVGGNNSLSDVIAGVSLIPTAGSSQQAGNVWAGSSNNGSITTALGQVTGKVRTPGHASLGLLVAQEVDNGVAPETLPNINIANYSTQNTPGVTVLPAGSIQAGPLAGPIYVNGDLTLDGSLLGLGAVTLNNATIYLDNGGNLTANSPLVGTGSIFVTGTTQLKGLSNAVVNSGIAIFSQGNIQITGALLGVSFSVVEGVLYSHGNIIVGGLLASTFQVVGAMMAQSTNTPASGNISFTALTLPTIVYVPEFTQFGGYWSGQSMQGGLLSGTSPTMHVLFWREMQ